MYPGSISSSIGGGFSIVYGVSVVYHPVEPGGAYGVDVYGLSWWTGRLRGKDTWPCPEVGPDLVTQLVLVSPSLDGA